MRSEKISLSLSITIFYSTITFAIVFSSLLLTKSLVVRYTLINYSSTISNEFSHVLANSMGSGLRSGQKSRVFNEYTIIYGKETISDPYDIKSDIKMPQRFPEIDYLQGAPYVFVSLGKVDGKELVLVAPAYQLKVLENTLNFFTILLSFASAIVVIVVGLLFSSEVLNPLKKISSQLEKVKVSKLNTEIPEQRYREYQHLVDTLNSMLSRLKDGFERQEQFVSDASHELRTPLSSILANLKMLLRWGKDDPKVLNDSLEDMKISVKKLNSMVESLLNLSKGKMEINLENVDLKKVAEEIVEENQSIHSDFDFQIVGKGSAKTDISGLKEILSILVSNAVRYSSGTKKIVISVENDKVSVEDFGIGISQDEIAHIFDRFYRADYSRSEKGFGIGLSIAKKIADAMDAQIKVQSKVRKGSKFTVEFSNR